MPKKQISSDKISKPNGHFSQATVIEAKGRIVFISGMTSRRPDGTIAGIGDIEAQTHQVCQNVKAAVEAAGGTMDDICRVDVYVRNMERLQKKWETAKGLVPGPVIRKAGAGVSRGVVYFGTTKFSADEALDILAAEGLAFDVMQIRSFPFHADVKNFMESHDELFVIEQNRDGQMRTLLINELEIAPSRIHSVVNYDAMPITGDAVKNDVVVWGTQQALHGRFGPITP